MSGLDQLLLTAWVHRLGWTLIHSLWQGAAIAAAFWVLLLLVPQTKAGVRYLAGCVSLLALLVVCAATFMTIDAPALTSRQPPPVMHTTAGPISEPSASFTIESSGSPGEMVPLPPTFPAIADSATKANASPMNARPAIPWHDRFASHVRTGLAPVLPWLVGSWLLGVLALSLWRLGGLIATYRLRTMAVTAASDQIVALVARLADRLRVSRPVRVLQSAITRTPAVIGHLRPVILLPLSAVTGLKTAELEAIIAHELAHIRRYDYLVNLIQTVVETLLFHHPAVWWISRRIRAEREHCCDDLAVTVCGDRFVYASALTQVQQLGGSGVSLAAAATGGSLLGRIRRIAGMPERGTEGSSRWLAGVVTISIVTAAALGIHWTARSSQAGAGGATATDNSSPALSAQPAEASEQDVSYHISGIVHLPDGKPAVGAEVILVLPDHQVQFVDGKYERQILRRNEKRAENVTVRTNKDGRFEFPPVTEGFAVIVTHEGHYAEALVNQLLAGMPVVLQPPGRIEGIAWVNRGPSEQAVTISLVAARPVGGTTLADPQEVHIAYSAKPNEEGRFAFDRVPPGRYWLRRVTSEPISDATAQVQVAGTQTAKVALCATITGKLAAAPGSGLTLTPENTRIDLVADAPYPPWSGTTEDLNQRATDYAEFLKSKEYEPFKREGVRIAADGSFKIDDLPSAWYTMTIQVSGPADGSGKEPPMVGRLSRSVTLRAALNSAEPRILDLGTLAVQPAGTPDPMAELSMTTRRNILRLIEDLSSPESNTETRANAARMLGEIRNAYAVEALIVATKDPDDGVRGEVIRALGRIGDKRSVTPLIKASKDRTHESFKDALRALGSVAGEKAAEEILVAALADEDSIARTIAAKALEEAEWKPTTRLEKIRYLLAMDLWDDVVAAGPAAQQLPSGANQAEGATELDIPIVIALKLGDDGRPKSLGYPCIQFSRAGGQLSARLDVRFSSWPRTRWLFSVDLLDASGKVVGHAAASHETSGTIEKFPHVEPAPIRFSFAAAVDSAKTTRFRFTAQSVSTDQGNPLVFDKELPLSLALSPVECTKAIEAKWLRFERNGRQVSANMGIRLLSWPKAKYRMTVELHGLEGAVLAKASQDVESAGVILGVAAVSEHTMRFDLGSPAALPEGTRYEARLERIMEGATAATQASPPATSAAPAKRAAAVVSADVQKHGEEILRKMAEVNRYWLIGPPESVTDYTYDYKLGDDPSRTFSIGGRDPDPRARQGVSYSTTIHILAMHPEKALVGEIETGEGIIRLRFDLAESSRIECGTGVDGGWHGYFSSAAQGGLLTLDAAKMVPLKLESPGMQELFSDYADAGDGRLAPLTVKVARGDMAFHWTFRLYDPGLWLMDRSLADAGSGDTPTVLASVSNVFVNSAQAEPSKTAPSVAVVKAEVADSRKLTKMLSESHRRVETVIAANCAWLLPPLEPRRNLVYRYTQEPPYAERVMFDDKGNLMVQLEATKESPTTPTSQRFYQSDGTRVITSHGQALVREDRLSAEGLVSDSLLHRERLVNDLAKGLGMDCALTRLARDPSFFQAQITPSEDGKTYRLTLRTSNRDARLFTGTMLGFTSWAYMHDVQYNRSEITCDAVTHRALKEEDYTDGGVVGTYEFSNWLEDTGGAAPGAIHAVIPSSKDGKDQSLVMDATFTFVRPGVWLLKKCRSEFRGSEGGSTGEVTVLPATSENLQPIGDLLKRLEATRQMVRNLKTAHEGETVVSVDLDKMTKVWAKAGWTEPAGKPEGDAAIAVKSVTIERNNDGALQAKLGVISTVHWKEYETTIDATLLDEQGREVTKGQIKPRIRAEGVPSLTEATCVFTIGDEQACKAFGAGRLKIQASVTALTGQYHGHGMWFTFVRPDGVSKDSKSPLKEGTRAWGPEQATGEPDTPDAGDIQTAWASRTRDGQTEWLVLDYAESVVPKMVKIHETYNPGAVNAIGMFTPDGTEVRVWSGQDPTARDKGKGVSEIPIKADFKTKRVKIYLDSQAVSGWNEIDAV
ncbi:MAG TPA: M56 family metallopeptidase, partial [Phycisphaerae bacterium]|nr:M56 family metallopeptidase [Phycisphaerae bacterium]